MKTIISKNFSSTGKKTSKSLIVTIISVIMLSESGRAGVYALSNGLGLTPPMGWNTWNKYYCDINQTVIYTNTD